MVVIRCPECKKIRKLGTWTEIHPVLAEEMTKAGELRYILCPHCKAALSSSPQYSEEVETIEFPRAESLQEKAEHLVLAGTSEW